MMTDPLDELAQDLEEDHEQRIRRIYGDRVWELWRRPVHMGGMADAHGHGKVSGSCGDTMEVFVRVDDGVVRKASFLTDGCGSSIVCGSTVTDLALGKTPEALRDLDGRDVLEALGGLPDDDAHCAFLAANALHEALRKARDNAEPTLTSPE